MGLLNRGSIRSRPEVLVSMKMNTFCYGTMLISDLNDIPLRLWENILRREGHDHGEEKENRKDLQYKFPIRRYRLVIYHELIRSLLYVKISRIDVAIDSTNHLLLLLNGRCHSGENLP